MTNAFEVTLQFHSSQWLSLSSIVGGVSRHSRQLFSGKALILTAKSQIIYQRVNSRPKQSLKQSKYLTFIHKVAQNTTPNDC